MNIETYFAGLDPYKQIKPLSIKKGLSICHPELRLIHTKNGYSLLNEITGYASGLQSVRAIGLNLNWLEKSISRVTVPTVKVREILTKFQILYTDEVESMQARLSGENNTCITDIAQNIESYEKKIKACQSAIVNAENRDKVTLCD